MTYNTRSRVCIEIPLPSTRPRLSHSLRRTRPTQRMHVASLKYKRFQVDSSSEEKDNEDEGSDDENDDASAESDASAELSDEDMDDDEDDVDEDMMQVSNTLSSNQCNTTFKRKAQD